MAGPGAGAASISDGLLLHLDPAQALGAGLPPETPGLGASTLADLSGRGNSGTLVRMQGDALSGFVGEGTLRAPFALAFDGEDDLVTTRSKVSAPAATTIAIWFRTSQASGKLVGFESAQSGSSGDYDRGLVMSDDGRLHALAYRQGVGWATASTAAPVADGRWHHAVLSYDAEAATPTLQLHLDGELAEAKTLSGRASAFTGYWRLGGGATNGVPSPTRYAEYRGELAAVRVYGRILAADEIGELAKLGPIGDADAWSAPRPTLTDEAALAEGLTLHYDAARPGDLDGGLQDLSIGANRGVLRRMAGPPSGLAGEGTRDLPRAIAFDGVDDLVTTSRKLRAPDGFTIQLWFRSTYSGGKLAGFETAQDGSSGDYDRMVYLTLDGRVAFGTWVPGMGAVSVFSPPGHVDGRWHHVVATRDVVRGLKLYVDGTLVDQNETTKTYPFDGYWRFGGGAVGSWDSAPRKPSFRGQMADLRIYDRALEEAHVVALHQRGPSGLGVPQSFAVDLVSDLALHLDARQTNESGYVLDQGPLANHAQHVGSSGDLVGAGTSADPRGIRFGGRDDRLVTTVKQSGPDAFTLSIWFRPDDAGGKLIGFETARDGSSGDYDRVAYVSDDGRAHFGVWVVGKGAATLSSPATVVDGEWHHLVAVKGAEGGPAGMRLFLDGKLIESSPTRTRYDFDGYWRLGGGAVGSWPDAPRDTWFEGAVASVRVYHRALNDAEARAVHELGPHGSASAPTSVVVPSPTPVVVPTTIATPSATPTPVVTPTPATTPASSTPPVSKGALRGDSTRAVVLRLSGDPLVATSVHGCNPRASVVTTMAPDGSREKRLGSLAIEPCVFTVSKLEGAWLSWAQESARGDGRGREVEVSLVGHDPKATRGLVLSDAVLVKVAMPALDAANKTPPRIEITLSPASVRQAASVQAPVPGQASKATVASHFRVTVSGMPATLATRVSAPTWELAQAPAAGTVRQTSMQTSQLVVHDLVVTMPDAKATEWLDWSKTFLLDGRNAPTDERTVTIEYLAPDMKTVVRTVRLDGVGLVTGDLFAPASAGDAVPLRSFRVYAERVALS